MDTKKRRTGDGPVVTSSGMAPNRAIVTSTSDIIGTDT